MATLVAAIDSLVPASQTPTILGVVFSVVADWQYKLAKKLEDDDNFVVNLPDAGSMSNSISGLYYDEELSTWKGKFDATTVLGRRLTEDLNLWRKIADMSGLCKDIQQFIEVRLPWHKRVESSPYGGQRSKSPQTVPAAQVAYLVIYFLMISPRNMLAQVKEGGSRETDIAFPVTKVSGTSRWMMEIPKFSTAMHMARLLDEFGLWGIICEDYEVMTEGNGNI